MLVVFYFDAHWNYAAPNPAPAAPPQPYTQIPATTAQSLRKYLPASSRFSSWSSFASRKRGGQPARGHHVPLINITHDYEDGDERGTARPRQEGESSILFDSAGAVDEDRRGQKAPRSKSGKEDDFAASSSEEDGDSDSDEAAQLDYEKRRRERKGKYRADEQV